MTIEEEKAKAYDKALERARKLYEQGTITESLGYVFPELKESEDERIRKEIARFILIEVEDEIVGNKWIAWLEKQGEQKPTDKAESKFHEGDWVVISTSDGEKVVQIDSIEYFKSGEPRYITSEGRWFGNGTKAHLWTIQDAKDGDVLFQDLMCGKTFIYNGVNPDMAILYSFIISNDGKDVLPYHIGKPNTGIGNIEENKNIIYPATKEQRVLLFQKIKEAGYEWDAEKKELKKIEQKPTAWSEKVDLEKEKDAYICNHFSEGSDGGMISDAHREIGGVTYFDLSNIAEHFFELGLKAKG